MKKLFVAIIAIMSVAAGVLAAAGPGAPARAATVVYYGAGADAGSSPIGGGPGYVSPHGYTQATADYVVTTATALRSALASASSGKVIWIPGDVTIDVSGWSGVVVPQGVVLASDRGVGSSSGGLLYDTSSSGVCFRPRSHTVFSGLRCQGTHPTSSARTFMSASGYYHLEFENCEIWNHGYIGLYFGMYGLPWDSPNRNWVHHCTIYGYQQTGLGYGIDIAGTSVLIECNRIWDCRHLISGQRTQQGQPTTDFVCRENVFGDARYWQSNWTYGCQVDQHGGNDSQAVGNPNPPNVYTASGGTLLIYNNTFSSNDGHQNVGLRGIPAVRCEVYHNWTKKLYMGQSGLHDETRAMADAFNEDLRNLAGRTYNGQTINASTFINMTVHDNWYGSASPPTGTYANRAPVLAAIGARSVVAGSTLSVTVSASDSDGDSLTYSASGLPSGATFSASSRTFSWTPASGQAGTYEGVRFQVSDGSLSDYEVISITVTTAGAEANADVNGDGAINSLDMIRIGQHWAETGARGWISEDINQDGAVNVLDATFIGQHWTG